MPTTRAITDLYGKLDHFIDGRDVDSISSRCNRVAPEAAREPAGGSESAPGRSFNLDACLAYPPPLDLDGGRL